MVMLYKVCIEIFTVEDAHMPQLIPLQVYV